MLTRWREATCAGSRAIDITAIRTVPMATHLSGLADAFTLQLVNVLTRKSITRANTSDHALALWIDMAWVGTLHNNQSHHA